MWAKKFDDGLNEWFSSANWNFSLTTLVFRHHLITTFTTLLELESIVSKDGLKTCCLVINLYHLHVHQGRHMAVCTLLWPIRGVFSSTIYSVGNTFSKLRPLGQLMCITLGFLQSKNKHMVESVKEIAMYFKSERLEMSCCSAAVGHAELLVQ